MLIALPPPRIDVGDFDLVLDGNSLVAFMAQPGNSSVYAGLGGLGRAKQNFGVSGQTTIDMVADAVSQIDSQYAPSKILIVWEVRNDIFFGATVSGALARLEQYCLGRRSVGYRVLVIGCLPSIATPSTYTASEFNQRIAEANRLMRRDWRNYCDGFVDVEAITGLQNPADTSVYSDGIHLNAAGYALLFPAVNLELSRLRR
jgi:lysophospholipase L1-like esterase